MGATMRLDERNPFATPAHARAPAAAISSGLRAAAWFGVGTAFAVACLVGVASVLTFSDARLRPTEWLVDSVIMAVVVGVVAGGLAAPVAGLLWPRLRRVGWRGLTVGVGLGVLIPLVFGLPMFALLVLAGGTKDNITLFSTGVVLAVVLVGGTLPWMTLAGWMLGRIEHRVSPPSSDSAADLPR